MSPTPVSPTPAPAAAKPTLKTVLTDVTMVLGAVVTGGEAILTTLPSGPLNTGFAIGLPVLLSVVAALKKLGG